MAEWMDQVVLSSPIAASQLTQIYDEFLEKISKANTYDENNVNVYANLWLVCVLLEKCDNGTTGTTPFSTLQFDIILETKERCLLILEMFDLYTETPLEMLNEDNIVLTGSSVPSGLVSWDFQRALNFDRQALAQEEFELMLMANTPIPEHGIETSSSTETRWNNLQERLRLKWGEAAYETCIQNSMLPS